MLHTATFTKAALMFPQAIDRAGLAADIPDTEFIKILRSSQVLETLFENEKVKERLGHWDEFEGLPAAVQRSKLEGLKAIPELREVLAPYREFLERLASPEFLEIVRWIRDHRVLRQPKEVYYTAWELHSNSEIVATDFDKDVRSISQLLRTARFEEFIRQLGNIGVNSLESLDYLVASYSPVVQARIFHPESIPLVNRFLTGFLISEFPERNIKIMLAAIYSLGKVAEKDRIVFKSASEIDELVARCSRTMRAVRVLKPEFHLLNEDALNSLLSFEHALDVREDLRPLYGALYRAAPDVWQIDSVFDFSQILPALDALDRVLRRNSRKGELNLALLSKWATLFGEDLSDVGLHVWRELRSLPIPLSQLVEDPKFEQFISRQGKDEKRQKLRVTFAYVRKLYLEGSLTEQGLDASVPEAANEISWMKVLKQIKEGRFEKVRFAVGGETIPLDEFAHVPGQATISQLLNEGFRNSQKEAIYKTLIENWRYGYLPALEFGQILKSKESSEFYSNPENAKAFDDFETLLFGARISSASTREKPYPEALPRGLLKVYHELLKAVKDEVRGPEVKNELLRYLPLSREKRAFEQTELECLIRALMGSEDLEGFLKDAALLRDRYKVNPGVVLQGLALLAGGAKIPPGAREKLRANDDLKTIVTEIPEVMNPATRLVSLMTFLPYEESELKSFAAVLRIGARFELGPVISDLYSLPLIATLSRDQQRQIELLPEDSIRAGLEGRRSLSGLIDVIFGILGAR